MLYVAVFFSCLSWAFGQDCSLSPSCPPIKPMADVDFIKYSGLWIEYSHGHNVNYTCAVFDYILNADQSEYNITTDAVQDGKRFTGSSRVIIKNGGNACKNPKGDYMDFQPGSDSVGGSSFLPPNMNIFVLDTDYEYYTIEYECQVINGQISQTLCVQGREGKPQPDSNMVKNILAKNNINISIIDSRPSTCPNVS